VGLKPRIAPEKERLRPNKMNREEAQMVAEMLKNHCLQKVRGDAKHLAGYCR
jgi:hypothetical protein